MTRVAVLITVSVIIALAAAVMFMSVAEHFVASKMKVILIYSKTCPHCAAFKPIFEQYKRTNPGIDMRELDTTDAAARPFNSQITGFPTTIIVDPSNRIVGKPLVGSTTYSALDKFITAYYTAE